MFKFLARKFKHISVQRYVTGKKLANDEVSQRVEQACIFLFIQEKWNGNSSDSFEGFWEKLESLGQREALS